MPSLKVKYIAVMAICLVILLPNTYCFANSILDWFDWKTTDKPSLKASSVTNSDTNNQGELEDLTHISVPYEELGYEDQFLLETEKINGIAPSILDRCEHKVIMKIQNSCSEMTEEELAKLSIKLLNCQSEISGRNQVLCTDTMTLKECITPMDSELWNAYHIINNRARTVCYAMRQQQFRALSQLAVNKLMSSTLTQITNMDTLQELQKELNLLTADTLSSLKKGQLELLSHTGEMQVAQSRAHHTITNNIKHLAWEQILIQNTHKQLNDLSGKLNHQLESHSSQFDSLKDQQYHALENIIARLSQINANIEVLWNAIEKGTQQMLHQQEKMKKINSDTLENLKHINMSVLYLSNVVSQLKNEVERTMTWATDFMGGDGALLISVLLNTLYLVVGVLVTLFLQLTLRYRIPLLLAVGTNILLVYQHQPLSYVDLTVTIFGCWTIISLFPMCWGFFYKKKSSSSKSSNKLQTENFLQEENDDGVSTISSSRSESVFENYENPKKNYERIGHDDTDIHRTNNNLLNLTRSNSLSHSGRQLGCAALCRNGQSCRATATPGRQFCRRHLPH